MMNAAPTLDRALTHQEALDLVRVDLALRDALSRVETIDFSLLLKKLAAETGKTREQLEEELDLYRKFLALCVRYPEEKICPTGPIDALWHAHLLDTEAYARDCQFLFGQFLHHYPYFGMRGEGDRRDLEDAFSRSIDRFIRHWGIDPTAGDTRARSCRPQRCP